MTKKKRKLETVLRVWVPKRIVKAIESEELTLKEVDNLVKSIPPVSMERDGDDIVYRFEGRVSIAAIVTAMGSTLGTAITLIQLLRSGIT